MTIHIYLNFLHNLKYILTHFLNYFTNFKCLLIHSHLSIIQTLNDCSHFLFLLFTLPLLLLNNLNVFLLHFIVYCPNTKWLFNTLPLLHFTLPLFYFTFSFTLNNSNVLTSLFLFHPTLRCLLAHYFIFHLIGLTYKP